MPSMPWSKGGVEPPKFLAKDEKLPLLLSLFMGFQHALAMVAGIATSGGMLIAGGVSARGTGLGTDQTCGGRRSRPYATREGKRSHGLCGDHPPAGRLPGGNFRASPEVRRAVPAPKEKTS
mmetsp:Transcript_16480/g.50956  ORF Transcript_16480/g.50956 Transcript_16480/m.50956 type:complete len:121 (+) Transcript_16480:382-744(+)